MLLSDHLNEELICGFKNGGSIRQHLLRITEAGEVSNIHDAFDLVANPENEVSLMSYLVKNERFEEAAWLKQICDIVREKLEKEKDNAIAQK